MSSENQGPRPGDPSAPASTPVKGKKFTFRKGVRHFKVDHLLSPQERADYLDFLRRPTTTIDSATAWLAEKGHVVDRGAVHRHRKHIMARTDEVRRSAEFARDFAELARGLPGLAAGDDGATTNPGRLAGAFAEAAQTAFEQFFMQNVMEMKKAGVGYDPKQWADLSRAVCGVVTARRQVEAMRVDFQARAREATAVVEKAVGDNDKDVVERMKEILGV